MQAAVEQARRPATATDIGALLKTVGMTLVSTVGGAGGPLYGTLFLQMGTAPPASRDARPRRSAEALDAGLKGVRPAARPSPSDKTMVDALLPAVEALRERAGATAPALRGARAARPRPPRTG